MKVVQLNTLGAGGAANAAVNLHRGLMNHPDILAELVVLEKKGLLGDGIETYDQLFENKSESLLIFLWYNLLRKLKFTPQISNQKKRAIKAVAEEKTDFFSFMDTWFAPERLKALKDADVVHLHWVADFIHWPSFFYFMRHKKIIWTLHDLNPLTEGYHFQYGWDSVAKTLIEKGLYDYVKNVVSRKKEIINRYHPDIIFVSPSKWLAEEVDKSEIFRGYPVHHIFNGIDTTVYQYKDRKECRLKHGLPLEKKIVLLVAQDLANERKGLGDFVQSINTMSSPDFKLVTIGANELQLSDKIDYTAAGSIKDPRVLSEFYNAADYFFLPSHEDNLPNTMLESLCCGTPVIGYAIGGLRDCIKDGENGLLLQPESGFTSILNDLPEMQLSQKQISAAAMKRFSIENQVQNYIQLYKQLRGTDREYNP